MQGLSYLEDERPDENEVFEAWPDNLITPETIRPWFKSMDRRSLHNAANLTYPARQEGLTDDSLVAYNVAWIGACTLFDRDALIRSGGFQFWPLLPPEHAGEDRVAQWHVMERFGGTGLPPSAAVHLEAPTTVVDRRVEASDVVFPRSFGASERPEPPANSREK